MKDSQVKLGNEKNLSDILDTAKTTRSCVLAAEDHKKQIERFNQMHDEFMMLKMTSDSEILDPDGYVRSAEQKKSDEKRMSELSELMSTAKEKIDASSDGISLVEEQSKKLLSAQIIAVLPEGQADKEEQVLHFILDSERSSEDLNQFLSNITSEKPKPVEKQHGSSAVIAKLNAVIEKLTSIIGEIDDLLNLIDDAIDAVKAETKNVSSAEISKTATSVQSVQEIDRVAPVEQAKIVENKTPSIFSGIEELAKEAISSDIDTATLEASGHQNTAKPRPMPTM